MKIKRLLTIVGIFVAALIVLWLGLALTLRFIYPPQKIQELVETSLEESLRRDVTIQRAGLSIFPRIGFSLKNVGIANASEGDFSEGEMVSLRDLTLSVAILPLFRGKAVISELVLHSPRVLIEVDSSGTSNLETLGGQQEDTSNVEEEISLPVPVSLERLLLRDAEIVYRNRKDGSYARIDGLSQRARIELEDDPLRISTWGDTKIERIELDSTQAQEKSRFPEMEIEHNLVLDPNQMSVTVDSVSVVLQDSYIGLSGSAKTSDSVPSVDMQLDAVVYPENYNALVGRDLFQDGSFRLDAAIQGRVDPSLSVNGGFEVNDIVIVPAEKASPVTVRGGGSFSGNQVVDTFYVKGEESEIKFTSTLSDPGLILSDTTRVPSAEFLLTSPLLVLDEFLVLPEQQNRQDEKQAEAAEDQTQDFSFPLLPISVSGQIEVDELRFRRIVAKTVEGSVEGGPSEAVLSFNGNYASGSATGQLRGGITRDGALSVSESFAVRNASLSEVVAGVLSLVPNSIPLVGALENVEGLIQGTGSFGSDFRAEGATMDALVQTIDGTMRTAVSEGSLAQGDLSQKILGIVTDATGKEFEPSFESLSMVLRVDTGTVRMDTMRMTNPAGLWLAQGMAAFDGALDFNVQDRLPRELSEQIVALQRQGKGALQGLIENTDIPGLSDAIEGGSVPTDAQGRVILRMEIGGFATDPSVRFAGFGGESITQRGRERLGETKEKVRERIEEEAEATEDTIREELEEQTDKIRERIPGLP